MYVKLAIFAMMTMISSSLLAKDQHEMANDALKKRFSGYVVITHNEKLQIITYGAEKPLETCKFLKKKGIMVNDVTNYSGTKVLKVKHDYC